MTDGVVLKFSTTEAVAEQSRFDAATSAAIKPILDQAKALGVLEAKLREQEDVQVRAAAAQKRSAEAAAESARSFGAYGTALNSSLKSGSGGGSLKALPDLLLKVEDSSKKSAAAQSILGQSSAASAARIATVGQQANATVPFLQKLLGAAGQGGAAKGLGILTSGARALVTSMNPVGIATGVAASLLLTFGLNALTAQSQTEKLRESARAAQSDFSNLGPAIESLVSGFGRISAAQNSFAAFAGYAKEVERLNAVQQAIIATNTEFAEKIRRTGTAVELNVDQIRQLGEATQQTGQFFRDLETVSSGSGTAADQRQASNRLRESIGLRKVDNALIIDGAQARRVLQQAEESVGRQLQSARGRADAEAELSFLDATEKLNEEIRQRVDLEKVGNNEREARARLDREAEKLNRELTKIEKDARDAAIGNARSLDEQAASERKLREERESSAKVAEQRAKAEKDEQAKAAELKQSFDQKIKDLQKETVLLGLDGEQREKRAKLYELEAAAATAKIPVDEKLQRIMENTVDRYVLANTASKGREQSLRDEAQAAQDAIAKFVRYKDVLEQLRDDSRVVTAPSEEDRREAETQRAINDRLRQADVSPDSTEGIVIANQVRLNEEQKTSAANLEKIKDLGREAFSAVGQSIASAIQQGEGLRGVLRGVGETLTQLALQRSIQAAFNAGANALFGPPAGGNTSNARGNILPASGQPSVYAATGMVLDRFTTFRAGRTNVSAAEGGASSPEAILPLRRDGFGRLGVISADGSGGGGVTVVMPNVRNGEEARRIRPTIKQTIESLQRNGRQTMRAGR